MTICSGVAEGAGGGGGVYSGQHIFFENGQHFLCFLLCGVGNIFRVDGLEGQQIQGPPLRAKALATPLGIWC